MEILLIRHGKTQGNLERRYVGRTDEGILPAEVDGLVDAGRELEAATFAPEMIFCSPMKRTKETAKAMFPGKAQIDVDSLRETDFGVFEYHNYEELKDNPLYQAWIDSEGKAPFPEGEDGTSFRERCCKGFLECYRQAQENEAEKIAIVAHGGTIMAIMERFSKEGGYYEWQLKNGCSFHVSYDGRAITVLGQYGLKG